MKTILIISFTNLPSEPRVQRQINFLEGRYKIITAGFSHPGISVSQHIPIAQAPKNIGRMGKGAAMLLSGKFEKYYWGQSQIIDCMNKIIDIDTDLIVAHDIDTLPLALRAGKRSKVIFDAHEYAPLEFEDSLLFRVFFQRYKKYLCNEYIPQANTMMAVSEGIVRRYEAEYGVKPVLITNASEYADVRPSDNRKNDKIRIVHHGGAIPSRKIEFMIDMMKFVDDRFELNLMLVNTSPKYFKWLKKRANSLSNVNFLPPVSMREIIPFTNRFDIGLFLLPPVNFNYRFALPNKFFEFVQARLAVAIGPSEEMADILKQYDIGVVSEDFTPQSMARVLNQLDNEKIYFYKQQADRAAGFLSAEKNKDIFLSLVLNTLKD
ncbi:MAG: capsular biosynthesis protein [Nitrospirae bacterium]|nr:capsular biosynthesis protein [Nitrospirota bacterium]